MSNYIVKVWFLGLALASNEKKSNFKKMGYRAMFSSFKDISLRKILM